MPPLPPLTNFMISAITLNYRSMGSRESRLHLKEIIESHRPAILVQLETKIHSSQIMGFLQHTDFTDILAVEPCGFVGGIWVLWDRHRVEVEPVALEDQSISVFFKEVGESACKVSTFSF